MRTSALGDDATLFQQELFAWLDRGKDLKGDGRRNNPNVGLAAAGGSQYPDSYRRSILSVLRVSGPVSSAMS